MSLTISMSVAQLLKKETFDTHTKAEKLLAPKLSSIKTYSDYAVILKLFYGFFHPLEKQIAKFVNPEILGDIRERRNSLLILQDLDAIDHSTKDLPICNELPKINSSLEALGTMYVLEGSSLGGRMISKMLMKNNAVEFNETTLNFFNGYRENTGAKWVDFLSVLDQYEDEASVLVTAANETFTCLLKWMEQNL